VGIVGVVFAGGWYLLAPKKGAAKTSANTWTVVPELGPQRSGATLQGSF
jgi:hypothetical protein